MYFWRQKRRQPTRAEIDRLEEEARVRARQIKERMDQQIAALEKSQRELDDLRNGGPGGPDDSAGKARAF